MANSYTIRCTNYTQMDVVGMIVKHKRFKEPILAVRKLQNEEIYTTEEGEEKVRHTGEPAYVIDHIPTGMRVWGYYYKQAVAKALAKEMLEHSSFELESEEVLKVLGAVPPYFADYLEYYAHLRIETVKDGEVVRIDPKEVVPYDEWINSPEFEAWIKEKTHFLKISERDLDFQMELYESNKSLGWVPKGIPTGNW